jgi:hypothetical protein
MDAVAERLGGEHRAAVHDPPQLRVLGDDPLHGDLLAGDPAAVEGVRREPRPQDHPIGQRVARGDAQGERRRVEHDAEGQRRLQRGEAGQPAVDGEGGGERTGGESGAHELAAMHGRTSGRRRGAPGARPLAGG